MNQETLNRIKELTGGKSLEANINLVKSNARLASLIAKELKELWKEKIIFLGMNTLWE